MPTLTAYGDAAPDLVDDDRQHHPVEQLHRRRAAEPRRVPGQRNRSGRHRQRRDRRQPPGASPMCLRVLVPTTGLLGAVPRDAAVRHRRPRPVLEVPAAVLGDHRVTAGLTLGVERYRYPEDLPKVAAKSGGASLLRGARPARRADQLPAAVRRRRRRLQPWAVRQPGHRCSTRTRSRTGCSARSTDRRATPRRSECRDDADQTARSSSSASSG